jgi:LysM repeat protein
LAAGGLLAAWLGWRMWQRVDSLVRSTDSWGKLAFWAIKMVVIVAVLFRVGAWIYGTVNSAVIAAVNSPSIQTAGQGLVQLGAAADQLVGWDGSSPTSGIGADLVWDSASSGAIQMLVPVEVAPAEVAPVENVAAPVENVAAPVAPLELKPLGEMFVAAQVNAVVEQPTNAPTGEYIVQGGDSLFKIAKRLGVDMNALCKANGLRDCNMLRRGQKLIVPAAGMPALEADLNARLREDIKPIVVNQPQTVYYEPKLNQSYIPPTWNVIEGGEMSVGEPANMSTNSETFASFPTK